MLVNYLKIAFRNLSKHKLFSFINIFGLALGMCIGLIVIMGLQHDFSFDNFHPAPARTYRVISDVTNREGYNFRLASTPVPLAAALKDNYAFVENTVRLYPAWSGKAVAGGKRLHAKVAFTDPAFFKLFGFQLMQGNPTTALNGPNKIVLNQTTATRFFGSEDPVGKSVEFPNLGTFLVTGVVNNLAHKSHIDFDIYCSMSSIATLETTGKLPAVSNDWGNFFKGYTYVLLKKGATAKQLKTALANLSKEYKTSGPTDKSKAGFDLQGITDISPGEDLGNAIGRGATTGKVAAEATIAFIILLSACFNYTNLSLARSLKRAKEVGIRKVSGAARSQVFQQFLVESLLIAFISLALAYFMMECLKNYTSLRDEFFIEGARMNAPLVAWFLAFALFAGLLAGVVPAFTLSTFRSVDVLKNLANVKLFGRNGLRKALIVFQFSLSLVIIIFMQVFNKQFHYMATADYGFNREQLINIPLQGADYQLLKTELEKIPGVERVSASSDNLGRSASGNVIVKKQVPDPGMQLRFFDVDQNFIDNMALKMLAGSNFNHAVNGQEKYVIINEQALPALKFASPAAAIGQVILLNDTTRVQIAGVVKDFNFEGFEHVIRPMMFRNREAEFKIVQVRTPVPETAAANLVAAIKRSYVTINRQDEFSYTWFGREFSGNKGGGSSFTMLALLAFMGVTIACLGLLGMVVYTVEGRTKEVSIRKIMGAGLAAIMALLSKSFFKLIFIAMAIAVPLGWICSYFFLQIFAIRVEIGAGILVLACSAIFLLAFEVIGSQVYRVARTNPATNLRTE
jgi:putative ABC transport system permease protein